MENLIYELNNIKYLLKCLLVSDSDDQRKIERLVKKYECIIQGVKEINQGGLLKNGYLILNVLVPEKNIMAFQNEE